MKATTTTTPTLTTLDAVKANLVTAYANYIDHPERVKPDHPETPAERDARRKANRDHTDATDALTDALTAFAKVVAHSTINKLIDPQRKATDRIKISDNGNGKTLVKAKRDIDRLSYILLDGDERPADTIGDGADIVQDVILFAWQFLKTTPDPDFDRPTTRLVLDKNVIIREGASPAWKEIEKTPAQDCFSVARRAVMNFASLKTDPANPYGYIAQDVANPDDPETLDRVYYRCDKYADIYGCSADGVYTANAHDRDHANKIIRALNLTERQAIVLKYRLRGCGKKAIATRLGVNSKSVYETQEQIRKKATRWLASFMTERRARYMTDYLTARLTDRLTAYPTAIDHADALTRIDRLTPRVDYVDYPTATPTTYTDPHYKRDAFYDMRDRLKHDHDGIHFTPVYLTPDDMIKYRLTLKDDAPAHLPAYNDMTPDDYSAEITRLASLTPTDPDPRTLTAYATTRDATETTRPTPTLTAPDDMTPALTAFASVIDYMTPRTRRARNISYCAPIDRKQKILTALAIPTTYDLITETPEKKTATTPTAPASRLPADPGRAERFARYLEKYDDRDEMTATETTPTRDLTPDGVFMLTLTDATPDMTRPAYLTAPDDMTPAERKANNDRAHMTAVTHCTPVDLTPDARAKRVDLANTFFAYDLTPTDPTPDRAPLLTPDRARLTLRDIYDMTH